MSWNYRVMKQQTDKGVSYFEMVETYYDAQGKVISASDGKNLLAQERVQDILWVVSELQEAFKKPIIKENEAGRLVELSEAEVEAEMNVVEELLEEYKEDYQNGISSLEVYESQVQECKNVMELLRKMAGGNHEIEIPKTQG